MDAKELRIGNLIEKDGVIWQIFGIRVNEIIVSNYPDDNNMMDCYIDKTSPIPLTEEWLKKFGFELICTDGGHFAIKHPRGYKDMYKIHIYQTIGDKWHLSFSDALIGKDRDYQTCTTIQHVHQLQNLIYALTGEELTIT